MAGKKRRSNQSDKNEEQSRPNKDNVEDEEGLRATKEVPKSPMEELNSFIKSSMPLAEALKRIAGSKGSDDFDLEDAISNLDDQATDKLWTGIQIVAAQSILALLKNDDTRSEHEQTINSILAFATIGVAQATEANLSDGLKQTVSILHGVLPSLGIESSSARNGIAKLCEQWFSQDLPDKASFATNTICYLLDKAMGAGGKKNDIKRLLALQSTLYESPLESTRLKQLLLKAARSSDFYRVPEGQKFVSKLFAIDSAFTKQIHGSIKKELPGLSRSDATAIGEIYYKAWNVSETVDVIEEDCIQDIMYHAVLANRNLPKSQRIFEPLLSVLAPFHQAKNSKRAQSMTSRMWEPLLWRHLKCANSHVRTNAAQILFEAFPIENPDFELEIRAAHQEAQVKAMLNLLADGDVEVRSVAVEGVGKVLAKYWLIFSSTEIKDLMTVLIRDLAVDMSSPKIRAGVVKAMITLVKNCPHSHVYLQKVLPKLRFGLFDTNETVRVAMADLLLAIKGVRAIQYWSVCSLEDLMEALATDKKPAVCSRIVNLLFNSFFPLDKTEEAKIERCIYLITNNQQASRRFYLHCDKMTSVHDNVKFMLAVLVSIKRYVKTQIEATQNRTARTKIDSSNSDESSGDNHVRNLNSEKENESIESSFQQQRKKRRKLFTDPSLKGDAPSVLNDSTNSHVFNVRNSNTTSEDTTLHSDGSVILPNNSFESAYHDNRIVAGLIDIVCIMWMARSKELALKENSEYRSLLEKKAAKILTILFKFYRSEHDVHKSVIYLCSFLPHASVTIAASFCMSKLRSTSALVSVVPPPTKARKIFPSWTEAKSDIGLVEVSTYINALCNWGRGDDILELIGQWLTKDQEQKLKSPPRKKSRGVRFNEAEEKPRPGFALVILRYIMSHQMTRAMLLRKNYAQLKEIQEILGRYVDMLPNQCSSGPGQDEASCDSPIESREQVLAAAWLAHLKLAVVLHLSDPKRNDHAIVQFAKDMLNWTEDSLLTEADIEKSPLASHIVSTLLLMVSNLFTLHLSTSEVAVRGLKLAQTFLNLGTSDDLDRVRVGLHFANEVSNWSGYSKAADISMNAAMMPATEIPKILESAMECLFKHSQGEDRANRPTVIEVRKQLLRLLDAYLTKFDDDNVTKEVLGMLGKYLVRFLLSMASKEKEDGESLPKMPLFNMLIEVVTSRKRILKEILQSISANLTCQDTSKNQDQDSEEEEEKTKMYKKELYAYSLLMETLTEQPKIVKSFKSDLKEFVLALDAKLEDLELDSNLTTVKKSLDIVSVE